MWCKIFSKPISVSETNSFDWQVEHENADERQTVVHWGLAPNCLLFVWPGNPDGGGCLSFKSVWQAFHSSTKNCYHKVLTEINGQFWLMYCIYVPLLLDTLVIFLRKEVLSVMRRIETDEERANVWWMHVALIVSYWPMFSPLALIDRLRTLLFLTSSSIFFICTLELIFFPYSGFYRIELMQSRWGTL